MISNIELLIRLLLAALIGAAIGFEREVNNRPAGLRTHILVCIGAALITLTSIYGFDGGDPGRLAHKWLVVWFYCSGFKNRKSIRAFNSC